MILDVGVSGFWLGPNLDGNALTAKLNELGADGWEALGLTAPARANEGLGDHTQTTDELTARHMPARDDSAGTLIAGMQLVYSLS